MRSASFVRRLAKGLLCFSLVSCVELDCDFPAASDLTATPEDSNRACRKAISPCALVAAISRSIVDCDALPASLSKFSFLKPCNSLSSASKPVAAMAEFDSRAPSRAAALASPCIALSCASKSLVGEESGVLPLSTASATSAATFPVMPAAARSDRIALNTPSGPAALLAFAELLDPSSFTMSLRSYLDEIFIVVICSIFIAVV